MMFKVGGKVKVKWAIWLSVPRLPTTGVVVHVRDRGNGYGCSVAVDLIPKRLFRGKCPPELNNCGGNVPSGWGYTFSEDQLEPLPRNKLEAAVSAYCDKELHR